MKVIAFEYTPTELADYLTDMAHRSFNYTYTKGLITKEEYEQLISTVIVTPLSNRKSLTKQIKDFFFGESEEESKWVFPLVELPTTKDESEDD